MIKNYTLVIMAIILRSKNWMQIIFAKIFDKKIENIILRNSLKIYIGGKIGKADLSMFSEIFYHEYYNPEGLKINKNDTVFDIGANSGFFTYYASQKAIDGNVYAFEPLPILSENIEKNILLNNLQNIKVENIAIGNDTDESVSFYISKDHNGCHSLYERTNTTEKITVKIISLKKYCEYNNINKIDFLKLDCEGAEYEIINTENIDFIKNTVNRISMEYHDNINEHKHGEIVDILSVNNFTVKVKDGYIGGGYMYALNNKFNKK